MKKLRTYVLFPKNLKKKNAVTQNFSNVACGSKQSVAGPPFMYKETTQKFNFIFVTPIKHKNENNKNKK